MQDIEEHEREGARLYTQLLVVMHMDHLWRAGLNGDCGQLPRRRFAYRLVSSPLELYNSGEKSDD